MKNTRVSRNFRRSVLHREHHGVPRWEGGPRDPVFRRSIRAGAFAGAMGRADALKLGRRTDAICRSPARSELSTDTLSLARYLIGIARTPRRRRETAPM